MTIKIEENQMEIEKLKRELATAKADPTLLKAEFENSSKLQKEFHSFEAFAAFRRSELSGRVTMFDPKNPGRMKVRWPDRKQE